MEAPISSQNSTFAYHFEKKFDIEESKIWMKQHWHQAFYLLAIYLSFIYFGQKFMKNRQAFELRRELAVWNTAIAIFSIIAVFRVFPELIHVLKFGFTFSVCSYSDNAELTQIASLWRFLYVISKALELIDTVFIILRKKNLPFLHWYHHASVLIFCFYAYSEYSASGRWLVFMNFLAHSFRYTYLALKLCGLKLPRLIPISIDMLEICQMFLFCVICSWCYKVKLSGEQCLISDSLIFYSTLLALSFIYAFSYNFYYVYVVSKCKMIKKNQ